jgi:mannose/fructose/N-acetylgalactosamine-specific phosphotransferase system component IIB
MPIELLRVDERLIHGQVVVGWGGPLHADRIVVVDDALAASAWEQELYCLGVPPEIEASFVDVDAAVAAWPEWRDSVARTIVLVRDLEHLERLAGQGVLAGAEVNLGGLHDAPGREKVLNYLFLSSREWEQLRNLATAGVHVSAQDLPGSRPIPFDELGSRR